MSIKKFLNWIYSAFDYPSIPDTHPKNIKIKKKVNLPFKSNIIKQPGKLKRGQRN